MSVNESIRGVADIMATHHDRQKLKAAMKAAAAAREDYPLLPTSDVDARPALPEEAGDNLTPQQRLAVAALVAGATYSAAARAAGCGRKTLYNWRRQPAFAAAVERTSREAIDVVAVRVRNLLLRATRVVAESLVDTSDAPRHAFRVINSARLWSLAKEPASEASTDAVEGS